MMNLSRFNRIKFSICVVLTIVVLTTIINFGLGLNLAHSETVEQYDTVYVMAGDTLWDIANMYMPGIDTGEAVYKICKINDMKASDLMAGTEILVPVSYK